MAKKKTKTAKKATKTTTAKTTPVKKRVTKASAIKVKSAKPKTAKPKEPASVDGILRKYSKQRTTLGSQMTSMRKKIDDLQKKANDCLAQIDALSAKEKETATTISELDSRRDAEVSALLSKLGVKFSEVAQEDPKPNANTESADDSNSEPAAEGDDDSEANSDIDDHPKLAFASDSSDN
ncbi:MAG: hypothetical protein AB8B55_03490 [Mariniblastus sp.]